MRDEIKYIRALVRLSGKKGKVRINVKKCCYPKWPEGEFCQIQQQKHYLVSRELRCRLDSRLSHGKQAKRLAYEVIKPCEGHFSVWIQNGWEVL